MPNLPPLYFIPLPHSVVPRTVAPSAAFPSILMKFGKRLQSQLEETLPEWRDKYLSYKQLKKRLKAISAPDCFTETAFSSPERELALFDPPGTTCGLPLPDPTSVADSDNPDNRSSVNNCDAESSVIASMSSSNPAVDSSNRGLETLELTAEEADFIELLNSELDKFNSFFMEKEEEYVIRLQELKEKCEQLKEKMHAGMPLDSNEMFIIRREIVNFHGEMVLLENYSSVNYTGLVKILKKHDKRTGALLRMPYIRNVLEQPFFTTELLSKLVQECEKNLQSLFPPSSGGLDLPTNESEPLPATNDGYGKETDDACTMSKSEGKDQADKGEDADNIHRSNLATNDGDGKESDHACMTSKSNGKNQGDKGEDVDNIYRSTLAALRTIKELRQGSSTYNIFSLPPINHEENNVTPCTMVLVSPPN